MDDTPGSAPLRRFLAAETSAVAVDWTVLSAGLVGMGLAVATVVSGGVEDLSRDIRAALAGIEISDGFRDTVAQICAAAGLGAGPVAGATGMTYQGMPVQALLIYQASDFIGGLPREAGAAAAGPGPHTVTLSPDAMPVLLLVADGDDLLHEVDQSQLVAQEITLNGVTYPAGSDVSAAYTLSDPANGLSLSALHFGNPFPGTAQGPVFATAASNPLEPGESYTLPANVTAHNNEMQFSSYLGC